MLPRLTHLLSLLAIATATLCAVPAAQASQSSDGVAAVNVLRARMGEPLLRNNEALAKGCATHLRYVTRTGQVSHIEVPGRPGYSAAGASAARNSVLANHVPFVPQTTVATIHWYPGSPMHLFQLLRPALRTSGYAWSGSFACESADAMVAMRAARPAAVYNHFYSFPEDTATAIPVSEDTHSETPSPNGRVHLPVAQITGPYLLVYGAGFGARFACTGIKIVSATLTDEHGTKIAIRHWDDTNAIHDAGRPASSPACTTVSGGGFLVPERPLAPGTRYTVQVRVVGRTAAKRVHPVTRTYHFATAGGAADTTAPVVTQSQAQVGSTSRGLTHWSATLGATDTSGLMCRARLTPATASADPVTCEVGADGAIALSGTLNAKLKHVGVTVTVVDIAGNSTPLSITVR